MVARALLVTFVFFCVGLSQVQEATVYFDPSTSEFTIKNGVLDTSGVAFGFFNDSLTESGWGILQVQTNPKFSDDQQMFAAGFLEGSLTSERIYQNYLNMLSYFFGNASSIHKDLIRFFKEQNTWTRQEISKHPSSEHWLQVNLIINQFDGLIAGYQSTGSQPLELFDFQFLNGVGDLLDLLPALKLRTFDWENANLDDIRSYISQNGHCSALVKVDGALSDLWSGHSSWFTYGAMNRIYKHYFFDLSSSFVASKKMSFSSYPGFLVSLDDFYIMDSGLTMLQTTNSIINQSLYSLVTPQSLFAWQRVRIANSMAKDGKHWGSLFEKYNSGTYNNQYMVIDYNKFVVGAELQKGALYVVEQIPGYVEYDDVTDQLERGYWASYNIPYFEKIYTMSGYPSLVAKYGPEFSYQMCPRAKIFRRDQGNVVDLSSFQQILRYNDYKNDPYSNGNPGNAICSRFDLASQPFVGGCYDTKVTSSELQSKLQSFAINGPTTSHGIPPFQWTAAFNGTAHFGQPELFNFDFVFMNPQYV